VEYIKQINECSTKEEVQSSNGLIEKERKEIYPELVKMGELFLIEI